MSTICFRRVVVFLKIVKKDSVPENTEWSGTTRLGDSLGIRKNSEAYNSVLNSTKVVLYSGHVELPQASFHPFLRGSRMRRTKIQSSLSRSSRIPTEKKWIWQAKRFHYIQIS